MGSFKSTILTQKAHTLMAKLTAGTAKSAFTKVRASDHDYSELTSSQLEALTSIDDIKQEVAVSNVEVINEASVKVSAAFLNESLTTGYYMRTIALYANDPDEGEILYSVTVADEADWLPPYNNISCASAEFGLITTISNSENVSIEVDPNAVVNITQFNNFKDSVNASLSEKANDTDDTRTTTAKDVTGAINELDANVNQLSNPNLLINGDFQVWQRGTSFSSIGYTTDRWYNNVSSKTITKSNNGMLITYNGTSTDVTWIYQLLEYNKLYANNKLTLSAKIKINRVGLSVRATIDDGVSTSYTYSEATTDWQTITVTRTISNTYSGDTLKILFATDSGLATSDSLEIEWVKLEVGSIATPFMPKPYAEELEMCQRYYENNFLVTGHAVVDSNGKAIMFIPYKVTKRIKPTVSTDSSLLSSCLSEVGYTTKTPATIGYTDRGVNGTMIVFTGLTDIIGYTVTIADNSALKNLITADAEIY